jgi:thiol-disulfide isomerase/thioredoxin
MKKLILAILCLAFCLAAFSAVAFADDTGYTVLVTNENGEPVSGVTVQFCSDTECMMGKTDGNGEASFAKGPGSYTVHILKPAEGYLKDNTEYTAPDTPGLITIVLKAENSQIEETIEVPERGICFTVSKDYLDKGLAVEFPNVNIHGYPIISIYYYSPSFHRIMDEILDMNPAERTPEVEDEYTEKLWRVTRCLLDITLIGEDEYEALNNESGKLEDVSYYAPARFLTKNDGYVYLYSIPDLDDGDLSGEEIADYHACRDYMETVVKSLSYMPIEFENNETVFDSFVPDFSAADLNGNKVSAGIFAEHDLTVVNIWGTFCGPCIAEMPELGEWARNMDRKVALIGIVGDIMNESDEETIALAQDILKNAEADFVNLIPNDTLSAFLEGVIAFPTTIFVDSTGAIVGEPIVGADVDAYKESVEVYFSDLAA